MSESCFGPDRGVGTPELQLPEELREPLRRHLEDLRRRYVEINWARRVGFGRRPAVVVVDLALKLKKTTDADAINAAMKKAADGPIKGILQYCDETLVSADFLGNSHSSILDALSTKVMDGNFAKILSWYDNEWGYSSRVVDLALLMGQ